jgi:hypothetical protein
VKMETACFSKMWASTSKSTWRQNPRLLRTLKTDLCYKDQRVNDVYNGKQMNQ